jgi:hypothetical protein
MKRLLTLAILIGVALAGRSGAAHADGSWLDGALVRWNSPGMAVPAAPTGGYPDSIPELDCGRQERPVETAADAAVADAGWRLFNAYQAGWGVTIVWGLSGYDGMCRPMGYQIFVFADGSFAGTLSPEPMNSRFDGTGGSPFLYAPGDTLNATFQRYADTDPLCCPSRRSFVSYRIDRTGKLPVLVAESVNTMANEP